MASLDCSSFQIQKKHRYGRVKTNRYVPVNIYSLQLFTLLPPFFYKHSGCFGNGLIDVAEKPKNLKRFDNAGLIRNSCNQMVRGGEGAVEKSTKSEGHGY